MSVTATGTIGIALTKLVTHLSNSATWQDACGVSSAAGALRKIYWPYAPYQEIARPLIVVSPADGNVETRVSGGASTFLLPNGALQILACIDDDPTKTNSDNWLLFDNFVYGIIDDLKDLSGVSDNLNMTGFQVNPYEYTHPANVATGGGVESTPPIWEARILVEWRAV